MTQFELSPLKSDEIKNNHRPYYIASGEWMQTSMGYRAPFLLCHALNELGYEAYVTAQKQAPKLKTPLLTPEIIDKHKANGRENIAVYNEGVWGNLLQGAVVVRWIMNRLGKLANKLPESDDLFFYWHTMYSSDPSTSKCLCLPNVDTSVFNQKGADNNKRQGYAYYAHKYIRDGKGVISDKVKAGGISLCHDIPRTHEEIAGILKKASVLYLYEETVLGAEAALCGCPVVLVRNDYVYSEYGEDILYDYAVLEKDIDVDIKWEHSDRKLNIALEEIKNSRSQLSEFIDITQSAAAGQTDLDAFYLFVKEHERIYIYGTGITSTMVFNMLRATGIKVSGFITSAEYYSSENKQRFGLPVLTLSHFNKKNISTSGVITAMMRANVLEVAGELEQIGIDYYNPSWL